MKTIFHKIAAVIALARRSSLLRWLAAPFTFIGLLVALLVSYGENEYDPYE